jgi:hypothetical protein
VTVSSNSRLSLIYGTAREGEAIQIEVAGRWRWADVILVEPRWRRPTRMDGSRGKRVRIDDRIVLRLRGGGEIIRTTSWLMSRSARFGGVQGSLF